MIKYNHIFIISILIATVYSTTLRKITKCDVSAGDRVNCGYEGVDKNGCVDRGCCWQSTMDTPTMDTH
jgi:hypothetical protein